MPEHARLRPRDLPLATRLMVWRLVLPLLRRTVATDRLVGLLASPRSRRRDPGRERLTLAIAGRLWRRSEGTCLERSLTVFRELGRAGASPRLVLAMAREREGLVGHAWVEVDGHALLERDDPRDHNVPVVTYEATGERAVP
jgi:hypothetical protein